MNKKKKTWKDYTAKEIAQSGIWLITFVFFYFSIYLALAITFLSVLKIDSFESYWIKFIGMDPLLSVMLVIGYIIMIYLVPFFMSAKITNFIFRKWFNE